MEKLPTCPECKGEMYRASTAFIKCKDKACEESHFGIRHNEVKKCQSQPMKS